MGKKNNFGIKNLKISNKAKRRMFLCALAGQILVLCGCGKTENELTVNIPDSATILDTLDDVSDLTTMDEFLNEAKFISRKTSEESSFEELIEYYNESRKEQNLSSCNDALYKIGRMILMATAAEQLGIKYDDIVDFSFNGNYDVASSRGRCIDISYNTINTENVSGGIEVNNTEVKTKKFYLSGEIDSLAINTERACNHALKFNDENPWTAEDIDDVYKSYVEFILTSAAIEEESTGWFNKKSIYIINSTLNQEKIETFQHKKVK